MKYNYKKYDIFKSNIIIILLVTKTLFKKNLRILL